MIVAIIKHIMNAYLIVPKGGKVIILSFFRGKPYVLQIVLRNFAA